MRTYFRATNESGPNADELPVGLRRYHLRAINKSELFVPELTGSIVKYPARASLFWYLALIAIGALVLWQPLCGGSSEQPITPMDAVFTATSATCVTGLAVRSTEHDFSFAGQLAILVLIQLGGIGIMTVTTYAMFQLGSPQSLRARAVLSGTFGADDKTDLKWILRRVIFTTFAFEGAGFLLLTIRNLFDLSPLNALWHALFHSISAFCNAGFALHDDSLTRFQGDPLVNLTIGSLIVVGGIGFPVLLDLQRNWHGAWQDRWDRLHLHSKMMLIGSTFLLMAGTVSFLVLEWDGVLVGMPLWKRPIVAAFQSVSCRTAGFNTVEISSLTNAMLFISLLLMMIGAGSGSTAGGFKVSTVMVLVLQAWSAFRGRTRINFFRRTIPQSSVARATATALLFAVVAALALIVLLVLEQSSTPHPESQGLALDAAFEVASALGTVGLSTGLTTQLTTIGRVVLIVLMFVGRLGPISVFVALSRTGRTEPVEYPGEEPMIG